MDSWNTGLLIWSRMYLFTAVTETGQMEQIKKRVCAKILMCVTSQTFSPLDLDPSLQEAFSRKTFHQCLMWGTAWTEAGRHRGRSVPMSQICSPFWSRCVFSFREDFRGFCRASGAMESRPGGGLRSNSAVIPPFFFSCVKTFICLKRERED